MKIIARYSGWTEKDWFDAERGSGLFCKDETPAITSDATSVRIDAMHEHEAHPWCVVKIGTSLLLLEGDAGMLGHGEGVSLMLLLTLVTKETWEKRIEEFERVHKDQPDFQRERDELHKVLAALA